MQDRLQNMIAETAVLKYVGREEASSTATGSHRLHEIEAEEILTAALDLPAAKAAGSNGSPTVTISTPSTQPAVTAAKK